MMEGNEQNYLTPIEAIRVSAVIDSALEKLELLSLLSIDINPSDLSAQVSKNDDDNPTTVANILKEQTRIGKEYENLLSQRGNDLLITLEEKEKREKKLLDLHKNLKDNTKLLCRNLEETPNESSNWKKIKTERTEIQKVLNKCKQELLRGVFRQSNLLSGISDDTGLEGITNDVDDFSQVRYDEFLSKIQKEQASKQFLEDIISREKKTNEEVRKLREQVEYEKEQKEKEINEKTQLR